MHSFNGSAVSTRILGKRLRSSTDGRFTERSPQEIFGHLAAIVFIGLTIGWLIGLSVTPVVPIVISSLLTLAAFTISILSGVQRFRIATADDGSELDVSLGSERVAGRLPKVSPYPTAALCLGLLIGAPIGIYTRTHNLLGSAAFPSRNQQNTGVDPTAGVLFHVPIDERAALCEAPDNELESRMLSSPNPKLRAFAKTCSGDTKTLRAAVETFLCPTSAPDR